MTPDQLIAGSERERELKRELERAYRNLTEITSRLLLANEAVEATLSTHDRTELSERFLGVVASATGVSRAALILAEGAGFAVGATIGLDDEEQESLSSSAADMDACRRALARGRALALDPEVLAEGAEAPAADEGVTEEIEAGEEALEDEPSAEGEEEAEEAEADEAEVEEEELEEAEEGENGDAELEAAEAEEIEGEAHFRLYLPVALDGKPTAVLAMDGPGRIGRFQREDLTFVGHLLSQVAVALNRAALIEENERRLGELDALLKVSREITATLDVDAVLRAVVNTVSAVVPNDRAAIALRREGKLTLRAVSAMTRLAPDQAELFQLEAPLEYLALSPRRIQIAADDIGGDEDPPGAPVFGPYFERQEMRSFMAVPLKDDQGLLGFLILESRHESWDIEPAEGDALDILAAQATVAIRNGLLYSQIPLRGVAVPITRARARLAGLDARSRRTAAVAAVALLAAALTPVVPDRTGGPAEVRPVRFQGVRASSEGVVGSVVARGGDRVEAGQLLATMSDPDLAARLARLESDAEVARREVAAARLGHDPAAWRSAQVRLEAIERNRAYEAGRARGTELRAPFAGQVLELDLPQRAGQHLNAGESFCTVAALNPMEAVILVSEDKLGRIRVGDPVALKVMAFPAHAFAGRVTEVGWRGRPDARGVTRFEVRAAFANPDLRLRPGMSGIGKATLGRRSFASLALEPLARAFQLGWW